MQVSLGYLHAADVNADTYSTGGGAVSEPIPDVTTILNLRHMLTLFELSNLWMARRQLIATVKSFLSANFAVGKLCLTGRVWSLSSHTVVVLSFE